MEREKKQKRAYKQESKAASLSIVTVSGGSDFTANWILRPEN
jgi:hypothetical protein